MKGIKTLLYTLSIAFIAVTVTLAHTIEWPLLENGMTSALIPFIIGYSGVFALIVFTITWLKENWNEGS